jgi:hypothetical protein
MYQKKKLQLSTEMRDTNADWQMIYYANAVHGFTNPNMEMTIQKVLLTMPKRQDALRTFKTFPE